MKYRIAVMGLLPLILAACSSAESAPLISAQIKPAFSVTEQQSPKRWYQFQLADQGARIFQQNCAVCHGKRGEGAANWQKVGPDGKYPAPPLNGTGHAWHHQIPILRRAIKEGGQAYGGKMPAFEEKLSTKQIDSVIAWFQSLWSDEIYAKWSGQGVAEIEQPQIIQEILGGI
ncbi:MAG: cytochrome c [Candidatus Sedimenticola sp. 6PFRAG5]